MIVTKGIADGTGVKALFIDDDAFLVFGDGTILRNGSTFHNVSYGALDAAIIDKKVLIIGDDGIVRAIDTDGVTSAIETPSLGFADTLIVNPLRGLICVVSNRKVFVFDIEGKVDFEFMPPMNPLCAAFDKSGNNLAIGHGSGVSIYDLAGSEDALNLKTEGGVIAATFSPDTAFLVAATGVPSLVGWRLFDGVGFRMAGYPSKAGSFAWINNMPLLITSGGPVGVIWPFFGMDGPMGKNAETIRTRMGVVSAVAAQGNKILMGYGDGGVDFADFETKNHKHLMGTRPKNDAEIDLRSGTSRVVSMAFSANGQKCAYVAEDGKWAIARV